VKIWVTRGEWAICSPGWDPSKSAQPSAWQGASAPAAGTPRLALSPRAQEGKLLNFVDLGQAEAGRRIRAAQFRSVRPGGSVTTIAASADPATKLKAPTCAKTEASAVLPAHPVLVSITLLPES